MVYELGRMVWFTKGGVVYEWGRCACELDENVETIEWLDG